MTSNPIHSTHYEGCYRGHHACAMAMIERLERENAELIAERDRLRGALESVATAPLDIGVRHIARAALSPGGEGKV